MFLKNFPEETENVNVSVQEEKISEEISNFDVSIIPSTLNVEEISIQYPDSDSNSDDESIFYTYTTDKIEDNVDFDSIRTYFGSW